ncbi:hypothetical protein B9Z51_05715 [Limnohabitans sp. T6-5]|uniref:hypothetical protein n=1 Tax=Limnohabitans sp. T6-5 TaxID=1100724 RepID=UPI000D3CDBAD|nr:hypothetical protein [Limnohabitans sp. T6-5]PUE11766.1 hypothetical protein B9Z51_05715 [Limnohabitans sp. T6-5]
MKNIYRYLSAMALASLVACGGGGSGSADTGNNNGNNNSGNGSNNIAGDCAVLCVQSLTADKLALLKGDRLNVRAVLGGSLKDKATYSWDMGDASAALTSTQVSNYNYDARVSRPDNMLRITLTVNAKDEQGNPYTANRQMQVNVMQAQTVITSGNTLAQFAMAIDTSGKLQTTARGDDLAPHGLGLTAGFYQQGALSNFMNSELPSSTARSVYGCLFDESCSQSFVVTQDDRLLATGDDDVQAETRSTGVSGRPDMWGDALDSNDQPLRNIRHVQSRMAALGSSSYALRADGAVFAAGNNDSGRLGIGSVSARSERFAPMRDSQGAVTNAVQVAASAGKVYVLRSDGSLWAAGSNNPGVGGGLGIASDDSSDRMQLVATKDNAGQPLNNVRQIATDADGSVFAVRWDASLWVAGYNTHGNLGLNSTSLGDIEQGFRPALRSDGQVMTNVSWVIPNRTAYYHQTLVRTQDGALWFAGEAASAYGVAAADTPSDDAALRFAPVRDKLSGVPLSQVAAADFVKGNFNYAFLSDTQGHLAVLGSIQNTGMAYAVADPLDTLRNRPLSGQIMPTRFANWKGQGGWLNDRSSILQAVNDQYNGLTLALTDTGNSAAPTICKFNASDTVLVAIGCDGQLYLAADSANQYAVSSALVPMFPSNNGLRFKTGQE